VILAHVNFCRWGTLAAFAAKNYGCDVTGITLGKNQTKFGNDRIKKNGISHDKARILCMDYREIPGGPGHYTKIVSLEMAEVYISAHDDSWTVSNTYGQIARWSPSLWRFSAPNV
jgi:cyclopropane fatty-acyl-phospholipid synthase-like methyltransferase